MAIPAFISGTTFLGGTDTNIVLNDPGTAGAFLIAQIIFQMTPNKAPVAPSGWTRQDTQRLANLGFNVAIFTKDTGATGSGSYTFTNPGVSGDSGFNQGTLLAFSGVDSATLLDVTPVTAPTVSDTFNFETLSMVSPSTSPTDANCMLLAMGLLEAYLFGTTGGYTFVPPTGYTGFLDLTNNQGTGAVGSASFCSGKIPLGVGGHRHRHHNGYVGRRRRGGLGALPHRPEAGGGYRAADAWQPDPVARRTSAGDADSAGVTAPERRH